MSSRTQVLSLYRSLLRTSKGFVNYNFREYALRHVRESFASARGATGEEAANLYQAGLEQHKVCLCATHFYHVVSRQEVCVGTSLIALTSRDKSQSSRVALLVEKALFLKGSAYAKVRSCGAPLAP
eukprot:5402313-Pleurochrysis_carterae.AAC.3